MKNYKALGLACIFSFLSNSSLANESLAQESSLQTVKQRVMKEKNLKEASSEIQRIALEALHNSDITENVIILETELSTGTLGYSFREEGQAFMVFATNATDLVMQIFTAYHEAGHFVL